MSQSRLEVKVGFFVLLGFLLLAALLIQFSKGSTLFRNTETIILKTSNIGGLRNKASVLMSGVPVGTVSQIKLAPEGTNVSIYLQIYKEYKIRDDALFIIEQSGFLGDQFVAIYPGLNRGNILTNMSTAEAVAPFNMLEVARSASGFIQRIDQTAKKLDDAISDVRKYVLNEQTLTNLSFTVSTLRQASEDAQVTVRNVNLIIKSNGTPVGIAVSNLVNFTEQLIDFAQSAKGILSTNEPQISAMVSNLQSSTATLTNLLNGVQEGKGLAGSLFKGQGIADNISNVTANLAITTSNLNSMGFWRFLFYKPKPPPTNAAPRPSSGHQPFRK